MEAKQEKARMIRQATPTEIGGLSPGPKQLTRGRPDKRGKFLNCARVGAFVCPECGHGYSRNYAGASGWCVECEGERTEALALKLYAKGIRSDAKRRDWFYSGTWQRPAADTPIQAVFAVSGGEVVTTFIRADPIGYKLHGFDKTIQSIIDFALQLPDRDIDHIYKVIGWRRVMRQSEWAAMNNTDCETFVLREALRAAVKARKTAADKGLGNGKADADVKGAIKKNLFQKLNMLWVRVGKKNATEARRRGQKAQKKKKIKKTEGIVNRVARFCSCKGMGGSAFNHFYPIQRELLSMGNHPPTSPARVYGVSARRRFSNTHNCPLSAVDNQRRLHHDKP